MAVLIGLIGSGIAAGVALRPAATMAPETAPGNANAATNGEAPPDMLKMISFLSSASAEYQNKDYATSRGHVEQALKILDTAQDTPSTRIVREQALLLLYRDARGLGDANVAAEYRRQLDATAQSVQTDNRANDKVKKAASDIAKSAGA